MILACKPDKIKGKGQDKMRNQTHKNEKLDTQEFTWFTQFGYVYGQVQKDFTK